MKELEQTVLAELKRRYAPRTVIAYGSYADGSNNAGSDFDALVVTAGQERQHDTSFVAGVQLDVFVYPVTAFAEGFDCREFMHLADGRVLLDTDGWGQALLQRLARFAAQQPPKTAAERAEGLAWCQKMLVRTQRGDAEGLFRWHWVLTDSLEIFCDVVQHPYRGPKKALRWLQEAYPEGHTLYMAALASMDRAALAAWIAYIERVWQCVRPDEADNP